MLAATNIRLHKISSTVIEAFPPKDHAKDVEDLDLFANKLPIICSIAQSGPDEKRRI